MNMTMGGQIPSFGNWDFYDDLSVTQYFDSARHAGLLRSRFSAGDTDLFKLTPPTLPAHYPNTPKSRTVGNIHEYKSQKTGNIHQNKSQKTPKAVDEDLYKIPPEFLYQKDKKRVMVLDFLKRCFGLNCIA